jgi:hypothetical protein
MVWFQLKYNNKLRRETIRPESLIHLELEPWQWQADAFGIQWNPSNMDILGENLSSIHRRLWTGTYYQPRADQLLTTPKYKVRILRIAYWSVSRVHPDLTSSWHVVALRDTDRLLHNENVYRANGTSFHVAAWCRQTATVSCLAMACGWLAT